MFGIISTLFAVYSTHVKWVKKNIVNNWMFYICAKILRRIVVDNCLKYFVFFRS